MQFNALFLFILTINECWKHYFAKTMSFLENYELKLQKPAVFANLLAYLANFVYPMENKIIPFANVFNLFVKIETTANDQNLRSQFEVYGHQTPVFNLKSSYPNPIPITNIQTLLLIFCFR